MSRFRFVGGQRGLLRGVAIRLERKYGALTNEEWEVENEVLRIREYHTRRDLELALFKKELVGIREERPTARRYVGTKSISDLTVAAQKRVRFEREVITQVAKRVAKGGATIKNPQTGASPLAVILREVAEEAGNRHFGKPKSMGIAQYYNLRKKHRGAETADDFAGGYDRRGHRDQLGTGVRREVVDAINELIEEYKGKAHGRGFKFLTRRDIDERILDRVVFLRKEDPDAKVIMPSDSTIRRMLKNDVDQFDLSLVTKGRTLTDADMRRPGRFPRAVTYPLQWTQFDETQCPIFLFDRMSGIPLGRPWLAWIVDLYCGGILGFYVGFEPPSDHVIAQTLKHACLPKAYMYEKYPGIAEPWLPAGVPKLITFDNSLQGHANSIEQICLDLDVLYDFTRPRAPWMKAKVERMFKRLEEELLRHEPGYVFPPSWNIPKKDYDPQLTAIMDFNDFLALLHAWIAMRLHVRPSGKRAPANYLWAEGVAKVEPEFVSDTARLDALFGIVREGKRLDDRGVQFAGMSYHSDPLHRQRKHHGATQKVAVKCNPLDIRRVHVRAKDGSWIPAETREHPDWERLDLHILNLLNRQARERFGREDMEARVRSYGELRRAIADGYNDGMTAANAARAARVLGIGSPLLFARQQHDGLLNPLGSGVGRQVEAPPRIDATTVVPTVEAPTIDMTAVRVGQQLAIPEFLVDDTL